MSPHWEPGFKFDSYSLGQASQVVLVVKNLPANAGDLKDIGSIPGLRRSPGGGNSNPLQNSCLQNPMDRGAWQAIVQGVKKSWIQLNSKTTQDGSHSPMFPSVLQEALAHPES